MVRAIDALSSSIGSSLVLADGAAQTEQLWDLVFYLYEATQFFQLILAFALCCGVKTPPWRAHSSNSLTKQLQWEKATNDA